MNTDEEIRSIRYPLLTRSEWLMGIDYIKYIDAKNTQSSNTANSYALAIYFVPKIIPGKAIPANLTVENIRITELNGDGQNVFGISQIQYPNKDEPDNLL